MEGFRILGGEKIEGRARVDAAKNAVLPILAASLLLDWSPVIFVVFAALSGIILQVYLKKGGEQA